ESDPRLLQVSREVHQVPLSAGGALQDRHELRGSRSQERRGTFLPGAHRPVSQLRTRKTRQGEAETQNSGKTEAKAASTCGAEKEAIAEMRVLPTGTLRFLSFGFVAATASATATLASSPPAHAQVTVVYSNDVRGELEPCGCRNNPTGGMVRKET